MSKPTIFFDLETTGVSITQDRIIQIGAIKVQPDGTEEVKNVLLNPEIPIPEGASAVRGLYNKDVKNKSTIWRLKSDFPPETKMQIR